jgi:hypothetical protein
MAFKLTYSDGHETNYDDGTKWVVEDGVLKLGREEGKWTVLLSPSHWATVELVPDDGEGGDDEHDGDDDDDDDDDDS